MAASGSRSQRLARDRSLDSVDGDARRYELPRDWRGSRPQRGRCESENSPNSRPLERSPAGQGAALMTITRSIILDLWSAYASGEASQDTRALVDAFLRDDPEF